MKKLIFLLFFMMSSIALGQNNDVYLDYFLRTVPYIENGMQYQRTTRGTVIVRDASTNTLLINLNRTFETNVTNPIGDPIGGFNEYSGPILSARTNATSVSFNGTYRVDTSPRSFTDSDTGVINTMNSSSALQMNFNSYTPPFPPFPFEPIVTLVEKMNISPAPSSPECYDVQIELTENSRRHPGEAYKWQYAGVVDGVLDDWDDITQNSTFESPTQNVSLEDLYPDPNDLIERIGEPIRFRVWNNLNNYESNEVSYTWIDCSIELTDTNWLQTEDAKCNGSTDGTVTLNFKSDVETDYEMRYYIYEGQPSSFPSGEEENPNPDNPANFPQTVANVRFSSGPSPNQVQRPLASNDDGSGSYGGTTDESLGEGTYYILYQEVFYDPITGDVDVKSGELIPTSFDIDEPTEITFTVNVIEPICTASATGSAEISVSGGSSGTFQYSKNNGVDWQTENSFEDLAQGEICNFKAKLVLPNSAGECIADATENRIIATVSNILTVDGASGAVSPTTSTSNDGELNIRVDGGTPNFTFELYNVLNPTVVVQSVTVTTAPNNEYKFLGLDEGTYFSIIKDATCDVTSENYVLAAAETPTLSALPVTPISCNNANDATITVNATYPSATTFTYELRDGAVIATSNLIRTGDIVSLNTPSSENIPITNVAPGTYWLFVKAAASDFSSVSIPEIINPNLITVGVTAVPFTCSDSTDGSITVVASGATNYDYQLSTDLFTWLPLTGTTIPVADPNLYTVTLRDRDNPSCESVASNQVEVIRPSEISVAETITSASANGIADGAIAIDINGGTANYSITWAGPNGFSSNLEDIDLLFGGTYTLEIRDANFTTITNGCYFSQSYEVPEPGPLSIQPLTGTDTCNGLTSGAITATVQGTGDILFEFLLNPGTPTETVVFTVTTPNRTITAPNLAAGTYGLRITEITSTNTITTPAANYFTISELTLITAISTPTDLACNETNTGVITITGATGGSNIGFEYAIDDGFGFQTGNTFTGLAPRTYIVTVRDDLGCEFTTTTEIVQAGAPVLNDLTTVVTNASSATNLDGAIVLEFETDPTNYTYAWSGPGLTGITTKDLNLIGAGTYQVIVSAPGNCTLTRNFTVGVQSAFSIQSFTGTATCFNQSIGSLTATIEATGLVTFNWILDDGTANGTLVASETTALRTLSTQGLDAGNYYLEIVNDNAQTLRSTNLVDIVELAEVSAVVTPIPTCVGEATGSITFTVPTGSPSNSYTYSIDNGVTFQASPIFENLAAATYTPRVSAFENPNCDYIAPGVTITNSPILFWDLPNSIITRASGPGATDGAISAAFTGGTAPYTFLWNPNPINSTILNITGVGAGIYNLTITDASNCSISQDFEVTEVGPLSITNIVPTAVLCRGEANGSITTTVTGEGTINYVWTLANGDPVPVSNGVNGPNITGIAAANYILTATDINSTVATASIAIGEPATALSITTITPNNISCFGGSDGSIAIAATGGSGGYTFSINGGAFQASPINGLIANSYTIRARDANDCEFTEPTPVLLTEPQELNLIINEQRPVTAASATDGAIFITAEGGSGNYTYNWTGPNGFTSTDEDILNLGAGDYSVTITDVNFGINNDAGCRLVSNIITIAEPGVLIATINQSVFLECSGDDFAEITANVQGGVLPYVYEWFQVTNGNNTALTEDTDIIANLSTGTYFLRVTDANSVTQDTNPVVITAPSQVVVTIDGTTNVLCVGQPTGSANITVTGGTPPYQYFWSNASTVADVNGLDAGEYTIEVEDANGCNAQNTITITAPDDAIQIADVSLINVSAYQAIDGSISLDVTGGSAPYNYAWTRVSDNSNAGNQATISNLAADSYTVVVSDANGCTITETYEVTQPDIIDETIIQPSCTDESDGSISVLVNQGNGTFTYIWNTGSTENNITNLGAGNYSVTVTSLADGPVTRTYVLENPVPLEVNLGLDRVLCAGQVLELDGTVDDETASYSWTSDTGFTSSNAAVVLNQTGNYTLTVQSQTGCTTQGTIFVDISTDVIDAEFAVSSQVFIGETIVAVDISFPLPDGIEWILPIGAEISTQDKDAVEFSFAEAGEYDITIITTRGDCIAQKTKKILVVAKDGLIQEEDDKSGQKLVEEFIVYPNPTSGRFTADINLTERGDVSVKVFSFSNNSLMASQKERGETSYSIPFDISGMPSGVYAVLLETPYGTSLRKIVVR